MPILTPPDRTLAWKEDVYEACDKAMDAVRSKDSFGTEQMESIACAVVLLGAAMDKIHMERVALIADGSDG